MLSSCPTVMPRRPLVTLPGLGPSPPVCLPITQRFPFATLRGLGTPRRSLVVGDELDRTAPLLLVRPLVTLAMRRRLTAVVPNGNRAASPRGRGNASEDPQRKARMRRVRRFGYQAIAVVVIFSLAELVVLLLA